MSSENPDSFLYVVRVIRMPYSPPAATAPVVEMPEPSREAIPFEPTNGTPPNTWMFQSNPELYDLRAALRAFKEQTWTVRRYTKEIRVGDRVYIWEAGRSGGILALAEITETPKLAQEPIEQVPFARDLTAFAGYRPRAKLRIREIFDPIISRKNIVARYDLASLMVLRCPRGTNFRVSREQVRALHELLKRSAAA